MGDMIIVPTILCGGSGTRLWPESRERHPKQFLSLFGEQSLLQETVNRSLRITGAPTANIVTVTLGAMEQGVRQQLSVTDQASTRHILSEPCARNTAAAVAYAAAYIEAAFGGDAMVWVLPADHHIGDESALGEAFQQGLEAARQGQLVTFGIRPTRPDTGYGYIKLGQTYLSDKIFRADRFVEKPDMKTAEEYLASGNYLWNSGMFLFRASDVLKQFRVHAPSILDAVTKAIESGRAELPDAQLYGEIPEEPFDKAIMEKSADVSVVPCHPEWSDVGSWESLWDMKTKDDNGNVIEGRVSCHQTKDCFIKTNGKRLIACAGVEGLVIVETEDAILITTRGNSDSMKFLVKGLKEQGCSEVLDPPGTPSQKRFAA